MNKDSSLQTMPRDWGVLGQRLDNWLPPEGGLDPCGQWAMHYARHSLIPEYNGKPGGSQAGMLHLEYTPKSDKLVNLQVSEVEQARFTTLTTQAEITCTNDSLLTPQRWSLKCSWQISRDAVNVSGLDQQHQGHCEGEELVFTATKERRCPAPSHWTSFWNLFPVIQRLPFDVNTSLNFDLFEAFDQHKPEQCITYAGKHTVALPKQSMNLHVFEQIGRGLMPWHWWLDDQHRLLLASGNRRAYLLMNSQQGARS